MCISYRRVFRRAWVALALFLIVPGTTLAQGGSGDEGLTLEAVFALARERSPRIAAAAAMAQAREAVEPSAGLPPDPVVQIGAMNLRLPDLAADMPNSMAPAVRLTQRFPFPGKLSLGREIAARATEAARADADEEWWKVRTDAARAFYRLYAFERQLEVMRRTLRWLDDLESVARAMYGAGTGRQSDVLRATVEVARMDASIATLRSRHEVAAARLNAVLDRPADAPLASPILPPLPAGVPPRDTLRLWAEGTRPLLRGGRIAIEKAKGESSLAARELWPDLSLGLGYGEREIDDDTRRMASFMVGLSLPIFARSRQLRLRDEARALERVEEARLTDLRAQVDAEIGEHKAELDRARSLLALYRQEVLPQAEANVESAFSLYRVGEVDFLTLVDAQLALNRFEQEYFGFIADYGIHIAELEMTVGRALPRVSEILMEVP